MLVPDLDLAVGLLLAVSDDLVLPVADRFHVHLLIARLLGLSPADEGLATGLSGGVYWRSRGEVSVGSAAHASPMLPTFRAALDPEEQQLFLS